MYYKGDPFDERLVNVKLAISNALADENIKVYLAKLGITEARLNEEMALYRKALQLYRLQKSEYSTQFEASRKASFPIFSFF